MTYLRVRLLPVCCIMVHFICSIAVLGITLGCGSSEPTVPSASQDDATTDPPLQNDVQVVVTNSIGMKAILIRPGQFRMGSLYDEVEADKDEEPHDVTISRPFFLGVCEVTQGEYLSVMGNNPSHFQKRVTRENDSSKNPVESVQWAEAVEFCRRLSLLPDEAAARRQYRLPTEAEWEYACRAGSQSAYSFGDDSRFLGNYAWYKCQRPYPVATKRSNAWGLHDMHGNVWEYCQDFYGPMTEERATDPTGPSDGQKRVIRGGSFQSVSPGECRSASRHYPLYFDRYHADRGNPATGFRVVMTCPELEETPLKLDPSWQIVPRIKQPVVPKLVVEAWVSGLGVLSGVGVGPGGGFGTDPYVFQVEKQVISRVTGKDMVQEFARGFPANRVGRIVFDSTNAPKEPGGDMYVSAALMGGGKDDVYRVKPTGEVSQFFSTRSRLTKGIAFSNGGEFGTSLLAISTNTDSLLLLNRSGQPSFRGRGIQSDFVEDDLIVTHDSNFGTMAYLTDQHRGKVLQVSREFALEFANTPQGMCIAQGTGAFGDFLYVGTAEGKVFRISPLGETTLILNDFANPKDADIRGMDIRDDVMWLTTDAGTLYKVQVAEEK